MLANQIPEELHELLIELLDEQLDANGARRLDAILSASPELQAFYDDFMTLHGMLFWRASPLQSVDLLASAPTVVTAPESQVVQPPYSITPNFLGSVRQDATAYFDLDEHPVRFSYLVTSILFVIGCLAASHIYVATHSVQNIAQHRPNQTSSNIDNKLPPTPIVIAHITHKVDCKWADSNTVPANDQIVLGNTLSLASGLIEIAYDTGARVILQGPCTYTLESTSGGFLAVGKLTAKLEKKTGIHADSTTPSPSLQVSKSPGLFFIRTPTATVTDLGTEFGVEVNPKGHTTSHVFRGLVELRTIAADGNRKGDIQLLHANQSARVEEIAENTGGNQNKNQNQPQSGRRRIVLLASSATSSDFVREIPKFKIKMFDLVDVVAGGNGFSGKRGAGIDPTNGLPCNTVEFGDNPATVIIYPTGDRKYHRVKWQPFIDGVFIPDGSRGPFQVDSARHMFIDCPTTKNRTAYHLWAGGAIPTVRTTVPTKLNGVDYASNGHGLLFMLANDGITFDLNAIRKANQGWTIGKFLTVVGNVQDRSVADFWVLVDGEVRDRRRQCDASNGAFSVAIPIKSDDRFLTLISTDGGDDILRDFIIFGDPRLELMCPNDVNTVALPDQRE